jgi:hypothetical protein
MKMMYLPSLRIKMNKSEENYIDHEVRVILLEKIASNIESRFDKIDDEIRSQFHWVMGTILAQIALIITLFGGIILHLAKLM